MKKPAAWGHNMSSCGTKGRRVGTVAKIVSVISLGMIVFTWLCAIYPTFLQGEGFIPSAVNESVNCECGTDHRVVEGFLDEPVSRRKKEAKNGISVLLGVFTVASKVERRNVIRMAYGVQLQKMLTAETTVRFVIGKPKSDAERLSLGFEVLHYNDLLILDCEENMNHGKSFSYFATVAACGIRYDYVMKLDDDSYVRVENLARSLEPLPRSDLYYGFVLPCEEQDAYTGWGYMAGMGYVVSWDIVEWVGASPDQVRNHTDGTEDELMGRWLKAGGKGTNRLSGKPLFYDHPEFGGGCAHALVPETILIHQVKTEKRWFDVLSFFEGSRVGEAIAPAIAS